MRAPTELERRGLIAILALLLILTGTAMFSIPAAFILLGLFIFVGLILTVFA